MKVASTNAEALNDWALLQLIPRVIHSSGQSAALFIAGLLIRLLERLLSLGPFIVSFLWLQQFLPVTALIKLPAALMPLALPQVCLMLLVMLLLQLVCSYCGQLFCFQGAYQIMSGYRDHAVSKVRTLPLHVLQDMQIGSSADVLTDDIKKVESIFTHIAADLLIALTTPLLMLALLTLVEWRLALSLCITLPLGWYLLQTFRARLMQLGLKKAAGFRATSALLIEFISGLTTLKLFNAVPAWQQKLESRFALMQQDSTHVEAWGAGPVLLYRISVELGLVIMLLTAGIMLMHDLFNPLHFLLFALLAYKILDGLLDAAAFLTVLRMAAQSEQHIQALLQTPTLSEPAAPQQPQHHEIAFKHVYFSYAGAVAAHNPWHLQDIHFTLPECGMLAIVGSSGAGKSTVASLLARFFDPQQGSISIGGVDLRAMGTTLLYQHISVVFQDVQLFDSTILDNVRIGRPDASDAEVIAACQAANCHHFIQRLQDGYQTTIGESGFSLSGGERQRLSIARAMLRDAPILLLDEATASLDVESQHEVQQALSRLVADKTVITIAHRLSTISHANQILVLQQGHIVEHGRHKDLLLRGGVYANLWHAQQYSHGQAS